MSVLTKRTATCDTCKETQDFDSANERLPDGWVSIMLLLRVDESSRQSRHLDLCPQCQETVLAALEVK